MDSYGYIETMGLLTAIEAADAALKSANVEFTNCYIVKGGIVTIELAGDVSAVKAAVEAGTESAKRLGNFLSSNVIARVDEETKKILNGNNFVSGNVVKSQSLKESEMLEEISEETESIEELDAIKNIVKGDIPTAEGEIPLYDEVVSSSEFSELDVSEEINVTTETVKKNGLDGSPYVSQERVTVDVNKEPKEEKKDNKKNYDDMKVSELRVLVKKNSSNLSWNQVKAMNKKKLVETLKKNNKDK